MKYEFDDLEEFRKAMENLSDYHDCEKCRGKMVGIGTDGLGNSTCGYCGEIVMYPRLSRRAMKEWISQSSGEASG